MPKAAIEPISPELQVYTERQTAELLGITAWTLARWRKAGNAPPNVWLSENHVGYRRRDVEKWLADRPTGARSPKDQRQGEVAP